MANPKKAMDLRAVGGYSDTYSDSYAPGDRLVILPGKHSRAAKPSKEPFIRISSYFLVEGDLPDAADGVWTAITTVWNNRSTYTTREALVAAVNSALTTAGYTVL